MVEKRYDVIIIGTGAGGGTLAKVLASGGKKILVLERGNFLKREKANWDAQKIFQKDYYRTQEIWFDKDGRAIRPTTHYNVGGNTKFYGAALFRFREQDFRQVIHLDGVSPEWELKYTDFSTYYNQAEKLYEVHGKSGLDPTESSTQQEYPFPPISHEPYIQGIRSALKDKGFHPFYLPLGIKLNETNAFTSSCIRCDTCDGFPCFLNAKADADVNCIRPVMSNQNLTLYTHAKVLKLHTNASGKEVTKVETDIMGQRFMFTADIVVVACGAINSALLLLKSANDKHPKGLANSSDLVGRNYMTHKSAVVMSLSLLPNPTNFQKTLGFNDFYWGEKSFPYPMGSVQLLGNIPKDRIIAHGPPLIPEFVAETMAKHSVGWLLMTEDLPCDHNRVRVQGDKVFLEYTSNNNRAFNRLIKRWMQVLKSIENRHYLGKFSVYAAQKFGIKEVGHQCGTCRFGTDPKSSVLDLNCRTHDVDNLYVVDSSFFPSSAAVNPSLTIIANALRVGEHLLQLLK